VIVPHLDLAAVERELARPHPESRTFLVTESLFSMEGDVAPLDRYADLAARHGAELIVDDAHATGLYGEARGSGLCEAFGVERRVTAVVSTLGKAVGLSGAFVAGPRVLVDYLVNRCRAFVFTTAPPPLLLHALDAALDCIAAEPWRRRRALELADRLRRRLRERGVLPMDGGEQPRGAEGFGEAELVAGAEVARVPGSSGASVGATATAAGGAGPIVPLLLGDNALALAAAERLAALGFDVRAIRPPTVPPGTARLRVSVHADHSEAEIDALAAALADALGTLPRGVGAEPVPLAVPSPSAPGAAQDRAAGAAAEPGTQIAGAGTVIAAAAGRTAGGEEP
jgi:7-keto-8-aminopelargonate synthetase-like enzyme